MEFMGDGMYGGWNVAVAIMVCCALLSISLSGVGLMLESVLLPLHHPCCFASTLLASSIPSDSVVLSYIFSSLCHAVFDCVGQLECLGTILVWLMACLHLSFGPKEMGSSHWWKTWVPVIYTKQHVDSSLDKFSGWKVYLASYMVSVDSDFLNWGGLISRNCISYKGWSVAWVVFSKGLVL